MRIRKKEFRMGIKCVSVAHQKFYGSFTINAFTEHVIISIDKYDHGGSYL